jgi:IclR helix-turn-helix domain
MLMSTKSYVTIAMEDGKHAVCHTSAINPANLEIIAVFYNPKIAQEYADRENGLAPTDLKELVTSITEEKTSEEAAPPTTKFVDPPGLNPELSEQQANVLRHLRKMVAEDKPLGNTKIAEALNVPVGSVHYALQTLEKKNFITAEKRGFGGNATKWIITEKGLAYN